MEYCYWYYLVSLLLGVSLCIVIGVALYCYCLGLACVLLLGLPCIVTAWITLCVFICVALVYLAVVGIACCLGSN